MNNADNNKATLEFLENSFSETLKAIDICLNHKKDDDGNVLGLPAAILMMSLVDSLGRIWRRNNDGLKDSDNFKVLNSEFFGLNIKVIEIEAIYADARSLMVHNGLMRKNMSLVLQDGNPFVFAKPSPQSSALRTINLIGLQKCCEKGVNYFKDHPEYFNGSKLEGEDRAKLKTPASVGMNAPTTAHNEYITSVRV